MSRLNQIDFQQEMEMRRIHNNPYRESQAKVIPFNLQSNKLTVIKSQWDKIIRIRVILNLCTI